MSIECIFRAGDPDCMGDADDCPFRSCHVEEDET